MNRYQAILILAFGGPEKREDIKPFLENVVAGKRISSERLQYTYEQYLKAGGQSPLNAITKKQAAALQKALSIPVYVGMLHWHPFLRDAVARMKKDGIQRAAALIMSPFQSEASWERYRHAAQKAIQDLQASMDLDFIEPIYNHPLFVEAVADLTGKLLDKIPQTERKSLVLLFTAHSLPRKMAECSPYTHQFQETARLVAERLGFKNYRLAYHSRSDLRNWLEPDILDVIDQEAKKKTKAILAVPIGFFCENLEIRYDIDILAAREARRKDMLFFRAPAVNDHPLFIKAIAEKIKQKMQAKN